MQLIVENWMIISYDVDVIGTIVSVDIYDIEKTSIDDESVIMDIGYVRKDVTRESLANERKYTKLEANGELDSLREYMISNNFPSK